MYNKRLNRYTLLVIFIFSFQLSGTGCNTAPTQTTEITGTALPSIESTAFTDISTSLKKITDRYASEDKFNGSVLVSKNGQILLNQGYGIADMDKNMPVTTQTRFCLASISKQFTAMAIMQLEEKGLLNVNDPISDYFTGYDNWKEITLSHLLNHTSGITTDVSFLFNADERSPKLLESIKDTPLEFEPGSNFNYCNTGYNILCYIIEKVTGQPYEKYMEQNIFKPLGMKNTGCAVTAGDIQSCAKGYEYENGKLIRQDIPDLYKLVGCCNIYSCAEDMDKWGNALYTDNLVKKETLDKIFTPGLNDYANGWFIETINGNKVALHGGGCEGVNARMIKYKKDNIIIVLLTNVSNCDLNVLITELDSALHP